MSVNEYKLPDVGEGLTEAEIVSWKVKVGDTIKVNDIVVEIETAKSLVELPSPYAGTVQALHVPEGETVAVGTPMITIGDAPAPAAPAAPTPDIDLSNPAATGGGENQTLVGYGPRESSAQRRPRRGGASPATDAGGAAQRQLQGAFGQGAPDAPEVEEADERPVPATPAVARAGQDGGAADVRVLAKPPVRKLAKDLGVDLRALTPTGPGGARRGARPGSRAGRAQRRTRPGEAAGAQARQGPRCRPDHPDRLRPLGVDHP